MGLVLHSVWLTHRKQLYPVIDAINQWRYELDFVEPRQFDTDSYCETLYKIRRLIQYTLCKSEGTIKGRYQWMVLLEGRSKVHAVTAVTCSLGLIYVWNMAIGLHNLSLRVAERYMTCPILNLDLAVLLAIGQKAELIWQVAKQSSSVKGKDAKSNSTCDLEELPVIILDSEEDDLERRKQLGFDLYEFEEYGETSTYLCAQVCAEWNDRLRERFNRAVRQREAAEAAADLWVLRLADPSSPSSATIQGRRWAWHDSCEDGRVCSLSDSWSESSLELNRSISTTQSLSSSSSDREA